MKIYNIFKILKTKQTDSINMNGSHETKIFSIRTANFFLTIFLGLILSASVFRLEMGAIFYFTATEMQMVITMLICLLIGLIAAYVILFLLKESAPLIIRAMCDLLISTGALIYLEHIIGLYMITFALPSLMLLIFPVERFSPPSFPKHRGTSNSVSRYVIYSAVLGFILTLLSFKAVNDFTNWQYLVAVTVLLVNGVVSVLLIVQKRRKIETGGGSSEDQKSDEAANHPSDVYQEAQNLVLWNQTSSIIKAAIIFYSILSPFSVLIIPVSVITNPPIHLFEVEFSYLWILFLQMISLIIGYGLGLMTLKHKPENSELKFSGKALLWSISLVTSVGTAYLMSESFSMLTFAVVLINWTAFPLLIAFWHYESLPPFKTVWIPVFQILSMFISGTVFIAAWGVDFGDLRYDYRLIMIIFIWLFMFISGILKRLIKKKILHLKLKAESDSK